jgi:hypothetical protein
VWPSIKTAWPYIASHGGIKGICLTLCRGETIQPQVILPETVTVKPTINK